MRIRKKKGLREWSDTTGLGTIHFSIYYEHIDDFRLDAYLAGTKRHIGVHSPHHHRSYFHLQICSRWGNKTYEEILGGQHPRYYMRVFEQALANEFGVNAWRLFC